MSRSDDKKAGALTRRRLLTATAAGGGLLIAPRGLFAPAIAQTAAIKVGVLAPLSGVYASLGTNKLTASKMLFNEKRYESRRPYDRIDDRGYRSQASGRSAQGAQTQSSRTTSMFCSASSAARSVTL